MKPESGGPNNQEIKFPTPIRNGLTQHQQKYQQNTDALPVTYITLECTPFNARAHHSHVFFDSNVISNE